MTRKTADKADDRIESEAAEAAKQLAADRSRKRKQIGIGVGVGIGSAALAAALLYANQRRKKD